MRIGSKSFLILVLFAVLVQVPYAQESASECLENAKQALDEEVAKKVDPELVAMQNKIEYPVKMPTMPWTQVFKNALKEVDAVLAKTYNVKSQEQLFLEISKKYAPFKVGERISVVQKVKYARTITGRYQGKNNLGHVHIGTYWIPISDFDDDTIARFDSDECDKLIKKKLRQAMHKQKLVVDSARRVEILRVAPRMLLENGYSPKNPDKTSRSYLAAENWESQDKRLEWLVNAQKEKLKEAIGDDFISKYMNERGFVYDEASEAYRSKAQPKQNEVQNSEPAVDEPKEQKNENQGIFQKMKIVF
ncbi:MAG: hypothetical protein IJS08_12945 [Victivallales bacterium]|nr:hypothetical protein [Victivallales bacterium]